MPRFVDVALNLPVDGPFTYRVPDQWADRIEAGCRVRVPFRRRVLEGTCVRVHSEPPPFECREVHAPVGEGPLFSPAMLRLGRWMARRYGASLGECLDAMLPASVRAGTRRRGVAIAVLLRPLEDGEERAALERRHPKQARVLRILAEAGGRMPVRDLCRHAKVTEAPVRTLRRKGFVRIEQADEETPASDEPETPEEGEVRPFRHSAHQRRAVEALRGALRTNRSAGFLLFGVTGSGKTEVYLEALETCVESGRQGVVLVPEIALTPQTIRRFRARFPRVAVLHSHLTDAERAEQWRRIRRGEADVVVGARSAIFAPTRRLGLVVVDEEHETTFKQQSSPRYDAREVARARCRFERAVLVLGSATPSLETYHRARSGRLSMLRLPERVAGGSFPDTVVADLRRVVPAPGRPRCLTDRLRAALRETVARGEQAILFHNRRGFAVAAICRACGEALGCPRCASRLVYHRSSQRMICHLCGHEEGYPERCRSCGGGFRLAGFGTQRVEEEIRTAVPEARVARMDSDSMRTRGAHEAVLRRFRAGEIDILVGTQMIAKGLDFPNVTLVGILSADHTLHIPDYRSTERTFDLIAQVAGRAGRSSKGGMVVVQTHDPDHYAIRLALVPDYERFASIELAQRRRDGYPPYGYLVRVVYESADGDRALEHARRVRAHLGEWIVREEGRLLGPAPCPIARIDRRHRFHIVLKARSRRWIRAFVKVVRALPSPPEGVRRLLDVDPLTML